MYEPNELKQIMYEQQAKVGCFKETKKEEYKNKRLMRLAKFTEVTHEVIKTLKMWGIPFTLCEVIHSWKQRQRITTDIFIPYANIVIRQYNVDDEIECQKQKSFYCAMFRNYYPFFIRSNETKEFVIEKLMNALQKANKTPQIGFGKRTKFVEPKKEPEPPKEEPKKKKRQRIKAVKVEPRKKQNSVH